MLRNSKIDAEAVLAHVLREGPDGLLNRGEARALIASRVMDASDSPYTARNRVGMMLDRASERGGQPCHGGLTRRPDGCFTVNEIAHWTEFKFPGVFADLPRRPPVVELSLSDVFGGKDSFEGEHMPGTLEECQELIEYLRPKSKHDVANQLLADLARKREVRNRLDHNKKK